MSGFNYYGLSTKNVISVPLILGSSTDTNTINGSNRNIQGTDISISRNYRNEYGVISDLLTFTYTLLKSNLEPFTDAEQIAVETWLTSPKKSSLLEVFDCNEEVTYKYLGLFTNTQWLYPTYGGQYGACQFTFSVNGSYPYEHYVETLNNAGDNTLWELNIQNDEQEEYVYPKLEITPHFQTYLPSSFRIINVTDDSKQMLFTQLSQSTGICVDCKHCMVTSLGANKTNLSFKNFGWESVGSIYFLRLRHGTNTLRINGEGALDVVLDYDVPVKKVGGWLI